MTTEQMGARIAAARRAQNLTQQQVADRIQVTKSTISRYESGEIRRPKFPVLTAIAEVLGVSPVWILNGECLPSASLAEPPEELPVISGPEGPFPPIGQLFAVRITDDDMRIKRAQTGDFLILRRNSAPVSYTHLDVYKRQGWARGTCAPGRPRPRPSFCRPTGGNSRSARRRRGYSP